MDRRQRHEPGQQHRPVPVLRSLYTFDNPVIEDGALVLSISAAGQEVGASFRWGVEP